MKVNHNTEVNCLGISFDSPAPGSGGAWASLTAYPHGSHLDIYLGKMTVQQVIDLLQPFALAEAVRKS